MLVHDSDCQVSIKTWRRPGLIFFLDSFFSEAVLRGSASSSISMLPFKWIPPELVCSVSSGMNLAVAFYVKCKLELSKYWMNLCMYQVTDAC